MLRFSRHLVQIAFPLLLITTAQAQPSAPAGDIVGVGNFAHIVADMEASLEFYRDVLGLEVIAGLDFSANPAIQAMGDTPDAESRITVLDVPGLELGIELIEYRGIDRRAQTPHFADPGAANISLQPGNLDALFPAIRRFPGVNVLTAGGEPVTITTPNGTLHAVFVQDPDGFVVELLEDPASAPIKGAAFEVTVADSETSVRFYNDLLGFDFQLGAAFNSNQEMAATAGAPGASFRQSRATIPGTSVPMILIEFKDIERKTLSGRTQDPGMTVLQLLVRDVDSLTARLKAAGVAIVSAGGRAVEVAPGLKIAIVRSPDNMLLELVERTPQPQ